MSAKKIPVIGIVGGIGSGKSTFATALGKYFQCGRLDADAAGHRALLLSDVASALRQTFGNEIFDEQGKVVRSRLAQRVFGAGEEQLAARRRLEQIVHPHIRREIVEQLERHQSRQDCDIILLDAALLIEAGWSNDCDAIIFLDVPVRLRRQRVAERGWTAADLAQREASQLDLEKKRQRADLIVDNSQEIETAARSAAEWIQQRFALSSDRQPSEIP